MIAGSTCSTGEMLVRWAEAATLGSGTPRGSTPVRCRSLEKKWCWQQLLETPHEILLISHEIWPELTAVVAISWAPPGSPGKGGFSKGRAMGQYRKGGDALPLPMCLGNPQPCHQIHLQSLNGTSKLRNCLSLPFEIR